MERIKLIRGEKPSTIASKLRKVIKDRDYCFYCKKEFDKKDLEIEHEIPVTIGGDLYQIRITCKICHNKKTNFDILFINFFKKIGLLNKVTSYEYEAFNKKELIKIYKRLYQIRLKQEYEEND